LGRYLHECLKSFRLSCCFHKGITKRGVVDIGTIMVVERSKREAREVLERGKREAR
jgi:hypothetical protein